MKHDLPRVLAIGSFIGLMGAFVKWGWEVPFPPRNPHVGFPYEGITAAVVFAVVSNVLAHV